MKSTITKKQQLSIQKFLKGKHIPQGLGTKDEACSIAAINLALYGELDDTIPNCMSKIIGEWIITIQDKMPDNLRNSNGWRSLLPLAAGTGRNEEKEKERLKIIMDYMWTTLELLQPIADKNNFGNEWKAMTKERTVEAALAAVNATTQGKVFIGGLSIAASASANAAAKVVKAATNSDSIVSITNAVLYGSYTATTAIIYAAITNWEKVDPCNLLKKLINA